MMKIQGICFILVIQWSISEGFAGFGQDREKRAASDECCVSSKLNVGAKKANHGRDLFRKLATESDSHKLVNPENMCNLMHFFIQQATLNNKSITFTKGTQGKISMDKSDIFLCLSRDVHDI